MVKWEYQAAIITHYKSSGDWSYLNRLYHSLTEILAIIGKEGWELVSITNDVIYIFKRPKQNLESYGRGGGGSGG